LLSPVVQVALQPAPRLIAGGHDAAAGFHEFLTFRTGRRIPIGTILR
jgi:hypothetical protein